MPSLESSDSERLSTEINLMHQSLQLLIRQQAMLFASVRELIEELQKPSPPSSDNE